MTDMNKDTRPVFLDLLRIRMPVTAVISIMHRLSGVLLFFALPVLLYALQLSLQSRDGYASVLAALHSGPGRLLLIVAAWALIHHFLAGIRYLLADMDLWLSRDAARGAAWGLLALEAASLSVLIGVIL